MSSAAASSWRSTFSNVPPLTKTVSTAMTVMTVLGFVLRFRDMAIASQHTDDTASPDPDPSYASAEASLVPLLAMVPVSGKYLERAWGSREFLKFLAVTSVGSMLGVYLTCLFQYVVRGNESLLYDTQAYGLTCVLAGFLVGFKQLVPEHLVTLWGVFSVRVKTLPMLFTVFVVIESLLTRSQIQLMMAMYGLFIAWVYSRFFKVQDGVRGDRSETFSFASFFPESAQAPVKAVSNLVFGILVRLRICSPLGFGASFQHDLENPQMPGMVLPMTQPASLRAEAERRRALALKALDMRLHAAAGNSSSLPGLSQKTFLGPTPSAGNSVAFPSIPSEAPGSVTSTSKDNSAEDNVLFETSELDEEPEAGSAVASQKEDSGPSSAAKA
ncbi:hypothetical protein BGZ75_000959 [Mortierella antarctica]|nr:hypothetical protein BGZ75_000959 [Mortierella antarctica]